MDKIFYVYLLIDPRTKQPFYVGKGCDNRIFYHEKAATRNYTGSDKPHHDRIREIVASGKQVQYKKVLENATEKQALKKEREVEQYYGRKKVGTGILLNVSSCGSQGGKTERPVSQHTLEGKHVADYQSAKLASQQVNGANRSYITQVCKGVRRSAGGYLWTYGGEQVRLYQKKYYKSVKQFSLKGKLLGTFRCLTEAQEHAGVELHNISECCRGKSKTAGGFIWRYSN
jgi:hypothetical protein